MSHNIEYHTFSEKRSEKYISDELNRICRERSDSHGGLYNIVEFPTSKIFPSYDAAEEYIESIDTIHNYRNFAVKFAVEVKESKRLEELVQRERKINAELVTLKNEHHFKNAKSSFIGCKECGSKISTLYMERRNTCPVCGFDMRPKTVLGRIASKQDVLLHLRDAIREERKKAKPTKIAWLAKIEYHT
ncbi:hypothetical protein [Eubacterium oxidoreducens]|uniref:Uncharacterized protein n=1 Tax=Eubacterium oxidoreducens TaxID=1732 RepID=A0A1G6B3N4_EUBOX|nr:hypothetical protein [Eubacterium oxidoreducens]SDB15033.1 hypothetical protein SAMN02910417_01104 [Eubacterium oxidoreducens]